MELIQIMDLLVMQKNILHVLCISVNGILYIFAQDIKGINKLSVIVLNLHFMWLLTFTCNNTTCPLGVKFPP